VRRRERLAEADVGVSQPRALGAELLDARFELVGHLVEGKAKTRELVASSHGDPAVEPPAGDCVRGIRETAERLDDRATDNVGDEGDQGQRAEQADQEAAVEGADGVVDPRLRREQGESRVRCTLRAGGEGAVVIGPDRQRAGLRRSREQPAQET